MQGTRILHGDFINICDSNGVSCARGWVCAIFVEPEIYGRDLRLEVKPLLNFNELPNQFQTKKRREQASGNSRLWLDERTKRNISPDQVLSFFKAQFGHPSNVN